MNQNTLQDCISQSATIWAINYEGTRDRSTTMKKCSSSNSIFSSTNSVVTCYHITHIHTTHSHFVTMNAQTLDALHSLSTWPAHYHPVFIIYINLWHHMAWCNFRSHSSVGWRKHFSIQVSQVMNHVIPRFHRLSDIVIHTHKFTILKSNSKGGVPAMFWTVEMPTDPVYCCARGQFQR